MEPVTHFLTGACLARTGFNRRTAYATLAMTLAAEAPDIDVFWGFRGPVAGFEHHRGITHTFLGAPFVALAVLVVVWLWHRTRSKPPLIPPRWAFLWLLCLLAVLSHIFLDWTNNYGVRPFFPFNPHWYSLDIAFILEPVIFAALLTALIVPSIFGLADREIGADKPRFRGRGWAIAAMVIIGIDLGVRAVEHHRALRIIRNTRFGDQTMLRVGAEPYPVDPFHWFAIVETPGYYQTGLADTRSETVDTGDQDNVIFKPPVTPAVIAAKRSWLGRVYLDWARFPLVTDRGHADLVASDELAPQPTDTAVEFRDLRFAYSFLPRNKSRASAALTAWVYVTPAGAIDAMVMNNRLQH
ncbi:MAG TPA: metal-dependent hydrolase [Acidobacteriaceae bacterium]|nr:metal-dependent hydrolase [Acidobacteriaceae bacterium]